MKVLHVDLVIKANYLIINLDGNLSKESFKNINNMIKILKTISIKNIFINLNNVIYIDNYGKNIILYICSICKNNLGNLYIYAQNNSVLESLSCFTISKEKLLT